MRHALPHDNMLFHFFFLRDILAQPLLTAHTRMMIATYFAASAAPPLLDDLRH